MVLAAAGEREELDGMASEAVLEWLEAEGSPSGVADMARYGIYEARTLAALIDDPADVTEHQMDAWAHDFDSRAICGAGREAWVGRHALRELDGEKVRTRVGNR